MKVSIFSPLIMVALIPIPAFLLGKNLTNNIGGLVTALFAVLIPSFIGVSMAGYCDTDAPIVFYFFFSILSTLLAIKKKKPSYVLLAILANLLFVWNWGGGWITSILFIAFLIALPIFRIFEEFVHTFSLKIDFRRIFFVWAEINNPLFTIIGLSSILGFFIFNSSVFHSFFGGLAFTGLGLIIRWLALLISIIWLGFSSLNFLLSLSREISIKKRIYFTFQLLISAFLFYLLFSAFSLAPTRPLIVNISVAELQPINIFSQDGFMAVAGRVGLLPTILAFGLFALAFYKIWKKEKISSEEVFFFIWLLTMFYLISRGVRFSLQFSVAASVAAGYVIGHYKKYPEVLLLILTFSLLFLREILARNPFETVGFIFIFILPFLVLYKRDEKLTKVFVFGLFAFQLLFFISNSIQVGQASGMLISKNWYDALDWLVENADRDSLITTWWDPGHILAGYSYYKGKPLRVHADGAHCGDCYPYNHDIRIRDMGRIFSTSNETEALEILKKYKQLTPEQCEEAKKRFPQMPQEACRPVSDIYIIASADLIGKYYWLSCFGSFDYELWEKTNGQEWKCDGRNFIQLPFSGQDAYGNLVYGNMLTLTMKDGRLAAVINVPQQGIRNAIVKEIVYYQQGQEIRYKFENVTNAIDGMVWVDPGFGMVIFMDPKIRDSIFTKMFFFDGKGLKHFELVYSNPEVKIFKVHFE
ncbi:MAG: hypothetical protein DRP00_00375 [Candidatus Aenigmatarchaeota archaeon]|nr:MAG: hypothetical protein DRP00_00375 [Candidatus Aenigmarchaeota archaeon]